MQRKYKRYELPALAFYPVQYILKTKERRDTQRNAREKNLAKSQKLKARSQKPKAKS
jgi:hypothetical protein